MIWTTAQPNAFPTASKKAESQLCSGTDSPCESPTHSSRVYLSSPAFSATPGHKCVLQGWLSGWSVVQQAQLEEWSTTRCWSMVSSPALFCSAHWYHNHQKREVLTETASILVKSILSFWIDWKGPRSVMLNKRTASLVLVSDLLCGCILPWWCSKSSGTPAEALTLMHGSGLLSALSQVWDLAIQDFNSHSLVFSHDRNVTVQELLLFSVDLSSSVTRFSWSILHH